MREETWRQRECHAEAQRCEKQVSIEKHMSLVARAGDEVGGGELASARRWGELTGVGRRVEMVGGTGRDVGKRELPLLVPPFTSFSWSLGEGVGGLSCHDVSHSLSSLPGRESGLMEGSAVTNMFLRMQVSAIITDEVRPAVSPAATKLAPQGPSTLRPCPQTGSCLREQDNTLRRDTRRGKIGGKKSKKLT